MLCEVVIKLSSGAIFSTRRDEKSHVPMFGSDTDVILGREIFALMLSVWPIGLFTWLVLLLVSLFLLAEINIHVFYVGITFIYHIVVSGGKNPNFTVYVLFVSNLPRDAVSLHSSLTWK